MTRKLLVLAAFLATVPAGYVLAHEGSDEEPSEAVPMAECSAAVQSSYEKSGFPAETFYPDCPTDEEAKKNAERLAGQILRYEKLLGHLPEGVERPEIDPGNSEVE